MIKRLFIISALLLSQTLCLTAQDFGFGDEGGADTGSGGVIVPAVSINGEVSASLLGYVDDFADNIKHTSLGDIFSGRLNFSAGTSFVEGVVIYHRHSRWLEEAPLKGAFNLSLVRPD
jgi:hypothetical protein